MRLRIDLAYDGTDFHGWAVQPGLRTVQGELSAALARALRVPYVGITCAGRTDTGVHARGQVVHVDVDADALERAAGRSREAPPQALVRRLNGILPADVRVRRVARGRGRVRRPLQRAVAPLHLPDRRPRGDRRPADAPPRAGLAAAARPGRDERGVGDPGRAPRLRVVLRQREGATTIRTLLDLHWTRDEHGLVVGAVRADAFCHSMVRSLVGCLIDDRRGPPPGVLGRRDPARGGTRPRSRRHPRARTDARGGRLPAR